MNYDRGVCKQCEKWSACNHPCNDFLDAKLEYDLAKKNKNIEFALDNYRGNRIEDEEVTDIEDVLDYSVEDIKWVQVINGKLPYTELISKDALLDFLVSENETYCKENNLCEICRNPLEPITEYEDGMISERYWACKHGC